mgnify:CR=1 FL=1
MADNNTILEKLEGLVARFEEVSTLITDPAVIADQKRYVKLTKEYKELGDQDIFGNSSGYMHYALEYDNVYSRVFYGYKEIYTPQIEWYNDGFFVSYYCPECPQSVNAGYAFVPESDLSSKFKSERREDGFYIYYELKSK